MLYRHAFVSLFVLFQIAHLTSHAFQCTVGLIFIDYKEGSYVFACATRSRFSFCELLPWYFRLCTYCLCMMYLTTSEVLSVHVSFHPHVSVSAHMGSFMSQQLRRSLKVTNHFLKWGTSS